MKYRIHRKSGAKKITLSVVDPLTAIEKDLGSYGTSKAALAACRKAQSGASVAAPKPKAKTKAKSKPVAAKPKPKRKKR